MTPITLQLLLVGLRASKALCPRHTAKAALAFYPRSGDDSKVALCLERQCFQHQALPGQTASQQLGIRTSKNRYVGHDKRKLEIDYGQWSGR